MRRSRALGCLLLGLACPLAAHSSVGGGTLTEDFSSLEHADLAATTGVWNVVTKQARAAAFANADSTRPITFGDGSDGAVSTAGGFQFNTDTHPNGYQFTSLDISGGTITVTGSNALVIRSLSTVNIVPVVPAHGQANRDGVSAVNGLGTASAGGTAVTCAASGGAGGTAAGAAAGNGQSGLDSTGAAEAGRAGTGQVAANTAAVDANSALSGPASNDFDNGDFICGTGGAGGGGFSTGGGAFAGGGGGGAGGGRLRIAAVGNITLTAAAEALGGNGGNGALVVNPPPAPGKCSGGGAGGNGGVIWMQTLATLTAPTPSVTAGSGASACFAGSGPGLDGFTRGDSAAGSRSAWAVGAGNYDTDQVPASTSSVVVSKPYDLSTWNASFSSPAVVSQTLNGGQISVQFAGSADGVNFGSYYSDLTQLSNRGYRYLKFQISIVSAGVAAASPVVTGISLSYGDLGKSSLDLKLAPGCGRLKIDGDQPGPPPDFFLHCSMMLLGYLYFRFRAKREAL